MKNSSRSRYHLARYDRETSVRQSEYQSHTLINRFGRMRGKQAHAQKELRLKRARTSKESTSRRVCVSCVLSAKNLE